MYQVFLGAIPLPIAPARIETVINGRNETAELIDGSQIGIINGAGLTEINFEFMLPAQKYPFASKLSFSGALGNTAILEYLEYLKTGSSMGANYLNATYEGIVNGNGEGLNKLFDDITSGTKETTKKGVPFQFIVVRLGEGTLNLQSLSNVNLKVTLEDYSIIEDAENGLDTYVSVKLKQYVPYGTTKYNLDGTISKVRP